MRIGVFCSGGDAPGMNACVRAVVRTALSNGHEVVGIRHGWQGVLDEDFHRSEPGEILMNLRSVSGWSRYGGAFLFSSRSEEFRTEAGLQKAAANLRKHGIDALVPIGGDGTFRGALALARHWPGQIIGCPGTIDNDLNGTDATIGFSTAVQTAVECVDKLRDTADSHERMFLVEVMGRHSGHIAVHTALAAAAEIVCIRETPTDIEQIIAYLRLLKERKKSSIMMIVAEGDEVGGANYLDQQLKAHGCPFSTRVMILGHLQRGGSPTPEDRVLSTMLGDYAVHAILDGHRGATAAVQDEKPVLVPFEQAVASHNPIPEHLLRLVTAMAF